MTATHTSARTHARTLASLVAGSLALGVPADPLLAAGAPHGDGAPHPTLRRTSPVHHVPLLELFTSEGCSSCPPADAALARLGSALGASDGVVALAFHVTYWDHIGWRDRFGALDHDQRERAYAAAWQASSVYTPALVLDGAEARGRAGLEAEVKRAGTSPRTLALVLEAVPAADGRSLAVTLEARRVDGAAAPGEPLTLRVAVFERGLETVVRSGENGGRTLVHDFVVRAFPEGASWDGSGTGVLRATVPIDPGWKWPALGVAGFVEGTRSRRVHEALAASWGAARE